MGDLTSILIPARNEAANLDFLIDEITRALAPRPYEIIVIDDGSSDDSEAVLAAKRERGLNVRHLRHTRSLGQSSAIRTGLLRARGNVIVTIDGDGQNDPAYIPHLLSALEAGGPDVGMAMGQRRGRTDGLFKRWASRFANYVRRGMLNDGNADSGCGLKAVRRDVFLILPFFDAWHRFMPALVTREGYGVVRIDVQDRPRRHGRSNYGIFDRGLRGLVDLVGVWWLMRRYRGRPDATEIGVD